MLSTASYIYAILVLRLASFMMENTTNEKRGISTHPLSMTPSHEDGQMHQATNELRRDLRPYHVFMFSIACAIGTGLVIGSGSALAKGGPGSTLIAYIIIGSVVFFVMTALGEMAAFVPMNKGFGGYANRMVDPAFGYGSHLLREVDFSFHLTLPPTVD